MTGQAPRRFGPGLVRLIGVQLFAGMGTASGFAVGGILAEQISGATQIAGFAQMSVILGAGLIAYPLAALASRVGRRAALTLGFGTGGLGALIVLAGVAAEAMPLFMLGMVLCGASTASGLQARFAASDTAPKGSVSLSMSLVVWATTVGSIIGPNFTEPGAKLGAALGMNPLAGPYVISCGAFFAASAIAFLLPRRSEADAAGQTAHASLPQALKEALKHPLVVFGVITATAGQMMMTNVMVMTPVHMHHQGFELSLTGIVISLHIAGMYGAAPLFGWWADRWGSASLIAAGCVVFGASIGLGLIDALAVESSMLRLSFALLLLGLGWSMFLIGGSTFVTRHAPANIRVPIQGFSDSLMNLGGALMAATAGISLQTGGFTALNMTSLTVLVLVIAAGLVTWAKARQSWHQAQKPLV